MIQSHSFYAKSGMYFLILAIIAHALAAIFNTGNFDIDGHFQILEFANYKLANISSNQLPWEFAERVRPGIQPLIAYHVHLSLSQFGFGDPFTTTLVLRFVSVSIGLFTALAMARSSFTWVKDPQIQQYAVPAVCLFWIFPFVHASFMSENWSGNFLCLGAVLTIRLHEKNNGENFLQLAYVAGLLLGMSFYLRFSTGFAIAGLLLWAIVVARIKPKELLLIGIGFTTAAIANTTIDYWLYGEWVITPANYFVSNIIEGRASGFGIEPWWYYFGSLVVLMLPPWSLILLCLIVYLTFRLPRNPLVWMFWFHLVTHSIVGHKEVRFLIPIINLLPILVILGIDQLKQQYPHSFSTTMESGKLLLFAKSFIGLNLALLLLFSFLPAHQSARVQHWIYHKAQNHQFVLNVYDKFPYGDGDALEYKFYKPQNVRYQLIKSLNDVCNQFDQSSPIYLFLPNFSVPERLIGPCVSWNREYTSLDLLEWFGIPDTWLTKFEIWTIHAGYSANAVPVESANLETLTVYR